MPLHADTTSQSASVGVLLSNLGTPAAPSAPAVRRFLREFLSDPHVVDAPRWLWLPVLHGIILPLRPSRSARAYARIWTAAGSPLLAFATRQAAGLAAELGAGYRVALGMRYGDPSLDQALDGLLAAHVSRIVLLPLYPQYSRTTTASTVAAARTALGRRCAARGVSAPPLDTIEDYHDEPAYVEALAAGVEEAWSSGEPSPDRLLLSFHGIPQRYARAGDPYPERCERTAALVAQRLGLAPRSWSLAYQSRVGRQAWLRPYTDEVLARWGAAGLGRVDVLCPGFSADCLETLEEIEIAGAARFRAAGGGELRYLPALNDRLDHLRMLAKLIRES